MIRSWSVLVCLVPLALAGRAVPAATTFERGLEAERELRLDEARDLFRQALRENPAAPGVAEHAAWFLFLNGFHDEECRDLLRQALPTAREPAAMERAARQIERELGQRGPADEEEQEAQRAFHRAMIEKTAGGTAAERGAALVDAGDFAGGIPLLEEAAAADPHNGPLALRLARAYVWSNRLPEADATYHALRERHPDNPVLLLEQGQVVAGQGRLEEALALLDAADKARPGDPRIMRERDRVATAIKARPAAPAKEELPAPLPPVGPDPVYKQGELAEKELRLYDARDLFRQAIRNNPDAKGVLEHAAWFSFLN